MRKGGYRINSITPAGETWQGFLLFEWPMKSKRPIDGPVGVWVLPCPCLSCRACSPVGWPKLVSIDTSYQLIRSCRPGDRFRVSRLAAVTSCKFARVSRLTRAAGWRKPSRIRDIFQSRPRGRGRDLRLPENFPEVHEPSSLARARYPPIQGRRMPAPYLTPACHPQGRWGAAGRSVV